jgi:hypothetical protein
MQPWAIGATLVKVSNTWRLSGMCLWKSAQKLVHNIFGQD